MLEPESSLCFSASAMLAPPSWCVKASGADMVIETNDRMKVELHNCAYGLHIPKIVHSARTPAPERRQQQSPAFRFANCQLRCTIAQTKPSRPITPVILPVLHFEWARSSRLLQSCSLGEHRKCERGRVDAKVSRLGSTCRKGRAVIGSSDRYPRSPRPRGAHRLSILTTTVMKLC